jgi:SAM-dependent methyltransferase
MATSSPTMFDEEAEFAGIKLKVDPIDRKRTDESDNVMAIFYEEQPFTWEFSKPYIEQALNESTGSIDFLDIGCGSGVFSILVGKHFPDSKIIALDKSPRAIEQAQENAKLNAVSFDVKHELYSPDSFPAKSAKVTGLYPPYHLYPEEIAEKIPQHARGGSDGQDEFKNQLKVANHHLADNGIIFFNQMCLGDENEPEFTRYIPEYIEGNPSVLYTNVFPGMSTEEFLKGVYADKHPEYVHETTERYPKVYYNVGIIRRDGKGEVKEMPHTIDLKGRTWDDRIKLHYEIAQHEYK